MTIRHFENFKPQLGQGVYVDPAAVVIGDVRIAEDSSVWPGAVLRADIHRITIGRRSSIQDGSVVHVTHAGPFNPDGFASTIGDDVTVGHKVMLHGCTVGNRVLVGMSTIILDGALVESEVVIGAGSLVPPGRKLESGYLYLGSPVKQIRRLTEKEISYFGYAASTYVDLKDRYLAQQAG